eukprot:1399131-Pyramimonas_sp.AAC.1
MLSCGAKFFWAARARAERCEIPTERDWGSRCWGPAAGGLAARAMAGALAGRPSKFYSDCQNAANMRALLVIDQLPPARRPHAGLAMPSRALEGELILGREK